MVGGGGGGLEEDGPLSAPAPERTITLIIHQHFFPAAAQISACHSVEGILCYSPLISACGAHCQKRPQESRSNGNRKSSQNKTAPPRPSKKMEEKI